MIKNSFAMILVVLLLAIQLANAMDKLVVVGGPLTEIVYAIGSGENIIGSDITSIYPKQAQQHIKVGYYRALSAEGIISLQPDLLICSDLAGPKSVLQQIDNTGIEVLQLKTGSSIQDLQNNIKSIATILNRKPQGEQLINRLNEELNKLVESQRKLLKDKNTPVSRVMFIVLAGNGTFMVSGKDTPADYIITLAGGINAVDSFSGYRRLTSESVATINPDIIITTDQGAETSGGIEALSEFPGISFTNVANANNIYKINSVLMLDTGPRTIQAARELFEVIYQ